MKIDVMGLKFDSVTMDEALSRAEALLRGEKAAYVVTPNAEIAYEALHDVQLREMLNGADLMLPDGAGVVLASKLLRTPVKQKVAGVDFAAGLLGILERNGESLYLLGGKPGIGELAAQKMLEAHPQLRIAGIADGYFRDEAPVIEKINASGADALFVCLGAPKQERFMVQHQQELHVHLMGASAEALTPSPERCSARPHG